MSASELVQAAATVKPDKDFDAQILLDERILTMNDAGLMTRAFHMIYRVDSQQGVEGWSSTGAQFSPWYEARPQVRARVITPDGVEHILDQKTLAEGPANENGPDIYENTRVVHGPLPAMTVGSIVEEEEIIQDTQPFFNGGVAYRLRFGRSVPVQHSRLVVDSPAGKPFAHVERQLPAAAVRKEEAAGRLHFSVENGPLEAQREIDSNLPGDVPPYPEVEFSTAASWEAVTRTYAATIEPRIRTADVKSMVGSSTAAGPRDKTIRQLVALLHKEIRYTGVEFDEASIIPQFPSETLKRKYGDCKDKASLLVAMLRATGIPAHLALLSTGPAQDVTPDLPGLGLFDHAIVFVPGPPDLWIDATAEYTRVGDLPSADRGRMALIIRDGTASLTRTPEAQPADNLVTETREFFLSEFGPARIIETTEPRGAAESGYRSAYDGAEKDETRKNLEGYVKDAYLADSLTKFEHSDVIDLTKPFQLRLEVAKGKRGFTDLDSAVAAIRLEGIVRRLPDYLRQEEEEPKPDDTPADAKPKKSRTTDFVFEPSVTEWHYRIVPPPGFQLHSLPANKTTMLGPAKLTMEYSSSPEGTVNADLRFDTVKGRYTPMEVTELRKGLKDLWKSEAIMIGFDLSGHVLMTSGKTREGLQAYEKLAAMHPKEALHRVQIAQALLSAGLAEKARTEATEATKLDPSSALAFKTLGWILQHDLVGRRFKKGFDLNGAIAAYRKAKELDPKDEELRGDLAILLEEDADGVRYSSKAKLDEAITEYRELKKMQKSEMNLADNIPYALMYAGRFEELKQEAASLSPTPVRKALQVTAVAASQGTAAAIEEASRLTSDDAARKQVLVTAATLLLRIRHYPQAADLLSAGAQGQSNSAVLLQQIETFRKAKKHEDIAFDAGDIRAMITKFFIAMISTRDLDDRILQYFSRAALEGQDPAKVRKESGRQFRALRPALEKTGLPLDVVLDLAIGNFKFGLEGDDATGYRVTLQAVGAANQTIYVVKEDNQYRILGFSLAVRDVGKEVLHRLERGDTAGARRWLDWVREEEHLASGDDPFAGPVFPRFWTKGQEANPDQMRLAAASLLASSDSAAIAIPILLEGQKKAVSPAEQTNFNIALAAAYQSVKRWNDSIPILKNLLSAAPDSDFAFIALGNAYRETGQWEPWEQMARQRLQRVPDDITAIRSLAFKEEMNEHYLDVENLIRPYVENGKATAFDLNRYAWDALFLPSVSQDAVEAAQRASSLTQNRDYSILHTLACLYAETGKTSEARELLLQALDQGNLEEPNSAIWYGFGRIAEQYGENDAAASDYRRVEKPEDTEPLPISTYRLAQNRLKGLPAAGVRSAK